MALFVGGLRDGDWFDVPADRHHWVVPERRRAMQRPLPDTIEPVVTKQMAYTRMKFRGLKEVYSIFAAPGLTPDKVLEKLIHGYSPLSEEASR